MRKQNWTTRVPWRTGWYAVRERMTNGCAKWSRFSLIKLERKMFKLYIATDDYYPERLFKPKPDSGTEYLRLEDIC